MLSPSAFDDNDIGYSFVANSAREQDEWCAAITTTRWVWSQACWVWSLLFHATVMSTCEWPSQSYEDSSCISQARLVKAVLPFLPPPHFLPSGPFGGGPSSWSLACHGASLPPSSYLASYCFPNLSLFLSPPPLPSFLPISLPCRQSLFSQLLLQHLMETLSLSCPWVCECVLFQGAAILLSLSPCSLQLTGGEPPQLSAQCSHNHQLHEPSPGLLDPLCTNRGH